jgi:transcriptional regulator with XRE-family HTH domain
MSDSLKSKLIAQRKERRIKQKDIASAIGVSSTALSRWENGKSELKHEHIVKYAEYLGFELKLMIK